MDVRAQKRAFTRAERVLAALLGAGFALGFVLTPLGVETRRKQLRSPFIPVFFIAVGLLMPLAGLILLLLRRPRWAVVLAIVDAGLLFLTAPADQAKLFFTVEPPPAVTAGEAALTLLGMGYLWYGQRVGDEVGLTADHGPLAEHHPGHRLGSSCHCWAACSLLGRGLRHR